MVRHKDEEANRRREEEEKREHRREEEEEFQERREIQQEKLKVLGTYKESVELMGYLEKFEIIMKECKISCADWAERLFPRLPERLCTRIASVRDNGVTMRQ